MLSTYERPFRPLESPGAQVSGFPLGDMAEQLRAERSYTEHGVDALTLVRSTELTMVLTIARGGHVLGTRQMPTTSMVVALEGSLRLRTDGGAGEILLSRGSAAAVGAGIDHEVHVDEDAVMLTVLGTQAGLEDHSGHDRRWTVESFERATLEVASLLEEVGLSDYRYEVEPADHGWRVRVERMSEGCWKSRDLHVSSETLTKARTHPEVRHVVLEQWRERLGGLAPSPARDATGGPCGR
ncbi:MAG: hypothetical protein ACOCUS_01115 [Polyangiales bacterium]